MIKEAIVKNKLIAILRAVPDEKLIDVAKAVYQGGIKMIEVTVNQSSATPEEDNYRQIKILVDEFSNDMIIGAGTVMNVSQAKSAIDAGAKFLLAPNCDEDVIKYAVSKGIEMIPGALTPTEIADAMKYGAKIVKVFPSGDLGIDYVKSIKAPISNANLIAVGGVDKNNMNDFIKAGCIGCGIGSNIANKRYIDSSDFAKITEVASEYMRVVGEL